jgi:hypothetical protein
LPCSVDISSATSICIVITRSGVAMGLWKHIQSGSSDCLLKHHLVHKQAFGVAKLSESVIASAWQRTYFCSSAFTKPFPLCGQIAVCHTSEWHEIWQFNRERLCSRQLIDESK